ncbi:MAG: PAS domain-containing protein, partial [Lachnospiraceae bacterium]|nr:PAS domain-containing protein [Lachnospiraceae bacterium]
LYAAKIAGKHRCMHFSPAMVDVKRTQLGFSLKDIANGMPGAFMIYSAAGDEEILFANQDLIRMTGCSDFEEFLDWTKHSFRGFVHPEDLDRVEESIQRQIKEAVREDQKVKLENGDQRAAGLASEGSHREDYVEYRIIRKDGGILPVVDIGRLIDSENYGEVFFVFIRPKDEFQKNY